jgi:hypothetical protein
MPSGPSATHSTYLPPAVRPSLSRTPHQLLLKNLSLSFKPQRLRLRTAASSTPHHRACSSCLKPPSGPSPQTSPSSRREVRPSAIRLPLPFSAFRRFSPNLLDATDFAHRTIPVLIPWHV